MDLWRVWFHLYRADGRVRAWRQPHKSMEPTCHLGLFMLVEDTHSCPSGIPTVLDNSDRIVRDSPHVDSSSNTLLTLGIYVSHINPRHEHHWVYLGCLATYCLEEISTLSNSYGFVNCPAGFMVWLAFKIPSDTSRVKVKNKLF